MDIMDLEKGRERGDGMEEDVPRKSSEDTDLKQGFRPPLCRGNSSRVQEKVRKSSTSSNVSGKGSSTIGNLPLPGLHTLYRRTESVTRSLAPYLPKGELVPLKPRLVTQNNSVPDHKKTKPPKFIPIEPYPGATNPIVPSSGWQTPKGQKINKNNLDIGVLVTQMSSLRTQEMEEEKKCESVYTSRNSEIETELLQLKEELKNMKAERDHYQSQFKFQTQVNAELKNLLVASVGEDLQTRVNVLTEDKLQLARALLDTANNLSTHTEQIEFLAGQSEVWRSKFLASSVMVEELARWKADLTQKNQMLNESTKRLLNSIHQLREMQLEMLKNLKFLAKIRYMNLPSTDVITISAENLNILQQMVLQHSAVGMPDETLNISSASTNPLCEAEKYAVQALEFVSQPLMATDEAIRALFGQAQRPFPNPYSVMGATISPASEADASAA